jgi:transcriptional regulator with XRE-family HTH domain
LDSKYYNRLAMVQKLREQKGWTQEHLAQASGMSLRTIQRPEAGKSVPKETIINVAAALDVAMEEIRDLYSLKKFHFVVISLTGSLLAILATSWFLYTREFSVQTQYLLNYRTFLAITSLLTGIIWGSGYPFRENQYTGNHLALCHR